VENDQPELDLTKEATPPPAPVPVLETIAKDQERVRGWIALGLLGLLAIAVLSSLAITAFGAAPLTERQHNLDELLQVIYGPLIALVSAATGFYFGGNKSK
jgi:hypothetical protein